MKPMKIRWPEAEIWNPVLLALVLEQQRANPTQSLDVSTGWSGSKRIAGRMLFEEPETDALTAFIQSQLPKPCILGGWGNILEAGQAIRSHDHLSSNLGGINTFAGIYYLELPRSAPLHLQDDQKNTEWLVESGDLVLFSATQKHSVPPAVGRRVSIAFNGKLHAGG